MFMYIACAIAIVAAIFLSPCSQHRLIDDLPFCPDVKQFGACGVAPWISWFLCSYECGWCSSKEGKEASTAQEKGKGTWEPIPRILASELTYDYFVENYKKKNIPLVIEGWLDGNTRATTNMLSWNLTKLSQSCGQAPVYCTQRREHAIKMLMNMFTESSPDTLKYIDYYLTYRFGTSCEKELEKAKSPMNLKDFIETVQDSKVSGGVDFRSLLDYMASALTVNDFPVPELCPEMAQDLLLPEWSSRESLLFHDYDEDRRLTPTLFIEPDGGRAYPAHQHGHDASHGFQVLLQGEKKAVFWPYSERDNLYQTVVTTEHQEEIYLAEGIHHRFDLFPAMKNTFAWEGTIKTGDLLYVPCMGVHVFESVGPSLGVRFAHHDQQSITCALDLLAANSTTIQKDYLNYMQRLLHSSNLPTKTHNSNAKTEQSNKKETPVPKNLKELKDEIKHIRFQLGKKLYDGVQTIKPSSSSSSTSSSSQSNGKSNSKSNSKSKTPVASAPTSRSKSKTKKMGKPSPPSINAGQFAKK